MTITRATKSDFDEILVNFDQFSQNPSPFVRPLHHPTLINEFGSTAFVIRDDHGVAAYLYGFLSQVEPVGYVHLTAVRRDCRRKGYAAALHCHFCDTARAKGCNAVKAIAIPNNAASIAFHTRMGMRMLGAANAQGIPVEKDHSGPGEDRVVFWKDLLRRE